MMPPCSSRSECRSSSRRRRLVYNPPVPHAPSTAVQIEQQVSERSVFRRNIERRDRVRAISLFRSAFLTF